MFAGAAREVVFSNPEVVRRVNEEFIPVALKAAHVNHPPSGVEGELYAEISRSKPASQGICTVNSAGKVLAWALSFDDDKSILKFLDHVSNRYRQAPDAENPVTAERFMKFPGRKLADVEDTSRRVRIPEQHASDDRCPATPALERGTLVGRIIGRPLGEDGKPVADTIRQEHYMEARFEVPVVLQEQLAGAVKQSAGKQFRIPGEFVRGLVTQAYLGQLDVNPLGDVPGSRNERHAWEFSGQQVPSTDPQIVRVHIHGESDVEGGQDRVLSPRTDGRLWEHRVTLHWQGYIDMKDNRITELVMVADGDERLRWGNARFNLVAESDVEHLMAGHPIDLDGDVRYGLFAEPYSPDEVVEGTVIDGT
ncbi:MAG: hypothetical protein O3C40_24340 [Planctomycetota bacterium]|nr:hypothetical protein [Planctomycetota bacterium]